MTALISLIRARAGAHRTPLQHSELEQMSVFAIGLNASFSCLSPPQHSHFSSQQKATFVRNKKVVSADALQTIGRYDAGRTCLRGRERMTNRPNNASQSGRYGCVCQQNAAKPQQRFS